MKNRAVLFLFSLLLIFQAALAEPCYYTAGECSTTFWKGYVFIGSQPAANDTVVEAFVNNVTLAANYTIGSIASGRDGYYIIPVLVRTIDGGHNVSFRVNGVYPYTGANASDASLQAVNNFGPNLLNISINKTANAGACRPYSGVTNATSYSHSGCSGGFCVHDLCRAASTFCGDGFCDSGESSSSCSADCGTTTTASSGGGGIAKIEETSSSVNIQAGVTQNIDITKTKDLAVDEVSITAKETVTGVSVTVKESSKPAAAPEPAPVATAAVYKYVEITTSNIQQSAISTAKVKFKVPKSWISSNSVDSNTVKLNRLVGNEWAKLSTTKLSEDATDITYEAETPGFSTFAITGEKTVTTTTQPATNVTTTISPTSIAPTTVLKTTTTVPGQPPALPPYLIPAVLVILLAIVAYYKLFVHKKRKRDHYVFRPDKK